MRLLQAMLGGCDLPSSLSPPPGLCSVGDDPDFLPFTTMGNSEGNPPPKKPAFKQPDERFDDHLPKAEQEIDNEDLRRKEKIRELRSYTVQL